MKNKKCFKCNQIKPFSDYYRHSQMADKHLNKCKSCTKKDATNHRWANIEKVRIYDNFRASLPHRKKRNSAYTKEWRKEFPLRYKAHKQLGNAIKSKKIRKPSFCEICKKKSPLEGHHDDYNKPLKVCWLCCSCHRCLHRDMRMQVQTLQNRKVNK